MEQNPSGIKSFLKKAAEKNGTQYDEAKADKLIETYNNNYDSIVGDIGRKVGIPEDGIAEFKKLAFEKFQIQPAEQITGTPFDATTAATNQNKQSSYLNFRLYSNLPEYLLRNQ